MNSLSELLAMAAWTALTWGAWWICKALHRRVDHSPLMHPVLLAMGVLILLVASTDTPFVEYYQATLPIHYFLAPATVALAVPFHDQRHRLRRHWRAVTGLIVVLASFAALSALGIGWLMGLSRATLLALAPKSVTSPIAIGIAEQLGGDPALAAGLVLITGAIGCQLAPLVFRWLRIDDEQVQGFTLGVAAHGFGTAQAFEKSAVAGAFAGLAMGMTSLVSAFLLPVVVGLSGMLMPLMTG